MLLIFDISALIASITLDISPPEATFEISQSNPLLAVNKKTNIVHAVDSGRGQWIDFNFKLRIGHPQLYKLTNDT